jgi:anaerobic C4-dicarboxylate transporter
MDSAPRLIEQGVRSYMQVILAKCNEHRTQFYNWTLNLIILTVFLGITSFTLWICHTKKLSPEEKYRRQLKDQEYVLTKIRQFQVEKDRQRDQMSELVNRFKSA